MLYLKISNPGLSPIECFTLLGVSTTRFAGDSNTIGEFGSGAKHAVNLLLRNDINPIIFCGQQRMEFFVERLPINDGLSTHEYGQVCYHVSGKDATGRQVNRKEKTSFTLEFGTRDWDSLDMGLREFVSNALDRTYRETGSFAQTKVEPVAENQVRAKAGETRVFIPLTPEVQKFYSQLGKRFLHFSQPDLLKQTVLPKASRGLNGEQASIFKRGVLVRQLASHNKPSLFDYNLETLDLDESRNVDDWAVRQAVAKAIAQADADTLGKLLRGLITSDSEVWEAGLDSYTLKDVWCGEAEKATRQDNWKKAWGSFTSDEEVLCGENLIMLEACRRKGKRPVQIKGEGGWLAAAEHYGLPTENTVLTADDKDGKILLEPTSDVLTCLADVWYWLRKLNLTGEKEPPTAKCFEETMKGERLTMGFYREGVVYVHKDYAEGQSNALWQTVLEEVAHHITGSGDMSRDFQEFAFKVATLSRKQAEKENNEKD